MAEAELDLWICVFCVGLAAIIGFTSAIFSSVMDTRRTERILKRRKP